MITKALTFGCKLVKLINGSYNRSKSECGRTRRLEVSASPRTRLLDIDG